MKWQINSFLSKCRYSKFLNAAAKFDMKNKTERGLAAPFCLVI